MRERIATMLWKRLSDTDMKVLTGAGREAVERGGGQPDLRLSSTKIRLEALEALASGTPHARVVSAAPDLDIRLSLPASPAGAATPYELEISMYGESRHTTISIMRQNHDAKKDVTHTNPAWRGIRERGAVGDTIFILRLGTGAFASGWIGAADVPALPAPVRAAIERKDQGLIDFTAPPAPPGAVARVLEALATYHNVLLYGPPATGKTYIMQQVAAAFARTAEAPEYDPEAGTFSVPGVPAPGRADRMIDWATFHQSYSYEAFVGARQPRPAAGILLNLEWEDGVLLRLAAHAAGPGGASLLLVDEINRGNASRIFGEFITLMEPDKRLDPAGAAVPGRTVSLHLPGRGATSDPFRMPYHLYTLASMNSVDRSVMPLDAALQRRFHIIPLLPDYGALATDLGGLAAAPSAAVPAAGRAADPVGRYMGLAIGLLSRTNEFIRASLGGDYEAGQGYFWAMRPAVEAKDPDLLRAGLVEAWNNRLLVHLNELFRTQPEQLAKLLRTEEAGRPGGRAYPYRLRPSPAWLHGGLPTLDTPPLDPTADGEEILEFIAAPRT